jgi:hypothetical protein
MASGKTGKIYRFSRIDGGKSFPVPIPEFLQILKKTGGAAVAHELHIQSLTEKCKF